MNPAELLTIIHRYYPQGISSFNEDYYASKEYRRLVELLSHKREGWTSVLQQLSAAFHHEYVRDRTDNEPSNRCVLYIRKGEFLFETVMHVSMLVPALAFSVKKILVNDQEISSKEIAVLTNEFFAEIHKEGGLLLKIIQSIFSYDMMPPSEFAIIIPDISTKNKELGSATVFDAIFADTIL
ncbi:MAG TPA: hypothetical protein VLC98_14370 [Phnomibacter sp.]|nr:hypothetical protein [Phnomibacter sp.]